MRYIILVTCLLFPIMGIAQEVVSYVDSGVYPITYYRLLEDSVYTKKPYDYQGEMDHTAPQHLDEEARKELNQTIAEALGEVRYQEVESSAGDPQVMYAALYLDSTSTIREIEFTIDRTKLKEKDVMKMAKALKGTRFKVPPYYGKFSYLKLRLPILLLGAEYL